MRILKNALTKILVRDAGDETRLGCPSIDEGARLRRASAMSQMTGGRGFRAPKAGPRVHPTFGTTRGERKRAARERCNEKERQRQLADAQRRQRITHDVRSGGVPIAHFYREYGCLAHV